MKRIKQSGLFLWVTLVWLSVSGSALAGDEVSLKQEAACLALRDIRNLTIVSAKLVEATESTPQYCYVKGIIRATISYHVQLPLPDDWNGRFLNWGDGGKDGDLDFANHRVAQGYAVANSNTGHDSGSEPGASFGFNNRQAEIDFGYRAVHLTVQAAKTVVKAYYGKDPEYSYHEGCSTGGRQGLMEAQRFPFDFDGIVAGHPVNFYQANNVSHVWMMQKIFRDHFAGAPAFDTDRDGRLDSLKKLDVLRRLVLQKCDSRDGITDGVIDDPLSCDFDADSDLADLMCVDDINAENCFTNAQIQTIKDIYRGPYDSQGVSIYKGKAYGSEFRWADRWIPHPGNDFFPSMMDMAGDHLNYLFYEIDPGIPMPDRTDLSEIPDPTRSPPEWAWWQFDIGDFTAGKGDFMKSITDATDPDLTRFLIKNGGKFILYHGWADGGPSPEATLDYYKEVVDVTFSGDLEKAREDMRLFVIPGMRHCGGGPGPNTWDRLPPLVEWVEKGKAPDFFVATHSTNGVVDNERPLCAYPQRAIYVGPEGGQNRAANWTASNFTCQ